MLYTNVLGDELLNHSKVIILLDLSMDFEFKHYYQITNANWIMIVVLVIICDQVRVNIDTYKQTFVNSKWL